MVYHIHVLYGVSYTCVMVYDIRVLWCMIYVCCGVSYTCVMVYDNMPVLWCIIYEGESCRCHDGGAHNRRLQCLGNSRRD